MKRIRPSRAVLPLLLLILLAPFQNCGVPSSRKAKEVTQSSDSSSRPRGDVLCYNQFCATFYDDLDMNGNYVNRMDDYPLDFDWQNDSPDPTIGADTFAAYWMGNFDFNGGTYTFSTTADDGVRVSIDGVTVIDAFYDQGPTTYTATRTLSPGIHLIEVQYYENGGGAVLKLSWQ
jgi:hypothetical protein